MQATVCSPDQAEPLAVTEGRRPGTFHLTTLTALQQRSASGYSREYVREQVLGWAARRWPALFAGRSACEPNFETHSGFADVKVATTSEGRYAWSFIACIPDGHAGRDWETRVLVVGKPAHDLVVVRNGYFGPLDFTGEVRQPTFLRSLIEHLDFDDGGFPVLASPRMVSSDGAFENFLDHLMSPRRMLPIVAITQSDPFSTSSRADDEIELNPWSLARKVCGLAHVVGLSSAASAGLVKRLGAESAVPAREARLFMPGIGLSGGRAAHLHFVTRRTTLDGADGARRARAAAYEWSVSHSRRTGFDALWSTTVGDDSWIGAGAGVPGVEFSDEEASESRVATLATRW